MNGKFRIGITRDFLRDDGSSVFGDFGLGLLEGAGNVEWDYLSQRVPELRPEDVGGCDGLLVEGPRVTARSLEGADRLVLIARYGAGYDGIDVQACTDAEIMVTNAPNGVRRPMAASAMTFVLALAHKLLIKDRLARTGRWSEYADHHGMGLTGRTLGIVGLGNIGQEVVRLSAPFEMRCCAFDPYARPESAAALGVELLPLESLMRRADFVVVTCALTPETRGLIGAAQIRWMKPTGYLINIARGPIVDQQAVTDALREQRIQGAGLDVFDPEPLPSDHPLLTLDNVILTPHAIGCTDECLLDTGREAITCLLDAAAGRLPKTIVNRAVLDHPRLRERLAHWSSQR